LNGNASGPIFFVKHAERENQPSQKFLPFPFADIQKKVCIFAE
jgi:hypothetical protein